MDYYELSAALFAEKIEVQRSSISHLLSGRNKPSLEFVLKIVNTFPEEVDLYWLLKGMGSFPKNSEHTKSHPPIKSETTQRIPDESKQTSQESSQSSTTKEIERVLIFFKDGTFKNYDS